MSLITQILHTTLIILLWELSQYIFENIKYKTLTIGNSKFKILRGDKETEEKIKEIYKK